VFGGGGGLIVYRTLLAVIFLSGTVLNTILTVVYIRRRSFRNHLSNRFLMNLVAVNLITCMVQIPLLLLDSMEAIQLPNPAGTEECLCRLTRGLWVTLSSASMFAQLLIGIDQHLAVVHSLHYHNRINESRCRTMCLATWIFSILLGLLASFDPLIMTSSPSSSSSWSQPSLGPHAEEASAAVQSKPHTSATAGRDRQNSHHKKKCF